ncbi:MAG: RibD family protein [Anaerolineales bacterium]|jgi:2,5-diamino-6-(ribosylamino)-4(3H)-pyrimidinone 5'-phosphate reductase
MLPHVFLHIGMSLDGRLDWVSIDQGLYYEIASRLPHDAILSGSNTILTADIQEEIPEEYREMAAEMEAQPDETRQLLAVVDSQGRIQNWPAIRQQPWWRQSIALCSATTPKRYLEDLRNAGIETIVAGDERVDLRTALEEMNARYDVESVRVDSGGILNGVLLREGLIHQISTLIHPQLVGGSSPRSMFVAPDLQSNEGVIPLRLKDFQRLSEDVIWLNFDVINDEIE